MNAEDPPDSRPALDKGHAQIQCNITAIVCGVHRSDAVEL